ncbi:aldehyde dehydrogenase family protein [Mangrovicoccus ximenensis]|uniref:aldehyde dehydrogenase family protein n=1 Tax=Mangrovicoccus ximenensis TaxID=1911570 RepID=UPI000D361C39|nr:aldehyde dehydrogenase family protein [Mangrovicoccus ximenensis]
MNKMFSFDNPMASVSAPTRDFLARQHGLFIGGDWVAGRSGERRAVVDPATGLEHASVTEGTSEDIDRAVAAARDAFENGPWPKMKPKERAAIVHRIGELIDAHGDEFAELDVLDEGSPWGVVRNFYVALSADHFRYFAGWATKLDGATMPVNMGGEWLAYSQREPVGVVGQILPWNVPMLMAAWKIAPALAAGCTLVVKPAEDTPMSALRLAELCREAGLPDGVLNVVTGAGAVGAALAEHPDVDKVSFTGSTATGKAIVRAAAGNLKRVSLELGGKSPVFVFPDADLDLAIPGVAEAVFLNSGQACTAGSRLYIHEDVYDRVLEGVAAYAEGLKLGHGFDPATNLGPLINRKQFDRVNRLMETGVSEGASIVTGGSPADGDGLFYRPTLLAGVTPSHTVYREEIFGPVISAMKITDETVTALAREANNTEYGLGASVWTKDLARAHKLAARIRAGIVWVNNHNQSDANFPWGGYKQSGWGREMGKSAIELYTETKSVAVYLGDQD